MKNILIGTAAVLLAIAAPFIAAWLSPIIAERAIGGRSRVTRTGPTIKLVLGDITKEHVDAIVNAAKPSLLGGGGVDGAIHRAAGPGLLEECRIVRSRELPDGLPTGQAVGTMGYRLDALFVIHTVGPVYSRTEDRSNLLRSCYTESLAEADVRGCKTVAFPLISSGVYGWPKDDAVWQAVAAIREARTNVKEVRLVVFDEESFNIAYAMLNG